jgi:hypothetical protein
VLELGPAVQPHLAEVVDALQPAWRSGYASVRQPPADAELRPFLARAAGRQLSDSTGPSRGRLSRTAAMTCSADGWSDACC